MKKILDSKPFKVVYTLIKVFVVMILVSYVLFLAVQRFSNNKSIAGFRVFTIATGSMEPVYNIDDVILVKEVNYGELKVGDDITYMGEVADFAGKIVTHRIVSLDANGEKIRTKGVASDIEDPEITNSQVFGKVSRKLNVFSFLTKLTRNKIGFYFLIFVPLVIVVFLEIVEFVSTARSDEDEENDEGFDN